tara:strand:+ start:136 stop:480 length:345 start_codon:yes stop_codon:yes gene_type:complete
MIIVHNITEGNEIKFIPREGNTTKVILTDEVTGEVTEETLTFTREGYYSVCTIDATLVDQRRYNLKVLGDGEEVLYNGIVFCSTQDNAEYSISNGEFDYDSAPVDSAPQYIIID